MKTLLYARSRSYRGSPRPVLYVLLTLLTVVFPAEPAAGQATALVPEPQTAAHAQAVDQAREFVREWMVENIHPPSERRSLLGHWASDMCPLGEPDGPGFATLALSPC